MFITGGILGGLFYLRTSKQRAKLLQLPRHYVVGCGGFFALSSLCLYCSIGLVSSRQQVIEIGLVNYLWPGLTVLFSVLLLKYRARLTLILGLALAFAGVVLSSIAGESFTINGVVSNIFQDLWAYIFAAIGAVSWALYSNLSRL